MLTSQPDQGSRAGRAAGHQRTGNRLLSRKGTPAANRRYRSMPKPAPAAPAPPFLLTTQQGRAARPLLSYVAVLPLSSLDAQLLAGVIAIRAAGGGTSNITAGTCGR
jgi:hypothetical protein